MNSLNKDHLIILDLPDEVLSFIFEKLNTIDVLGSLVDVNRRFHRLALNSLRVRDLNMTSIMAINSLNGQTSSIDIQVLSKICQKILPRIHHQVHKLTVDQYSMKQILLAGNYPQLYSLSLINFQAEILHQYLIDDSILRDLLIKQITHINIDIKMTTEHCSKTVLKIFALILSLCKNLIVLNFCDMFPRQEYTAPIFYQPSTTYISSTLIKLKIKVATFVDCLYLLDSRLDSLSTLIINVSQIFSIAIDKGRSKKLPKLKHFSFTAFEENCNYDDLIVPLLCRMINLEELQLYLSVLRFNSTYIDGIQLYDQFLIYMTQLKKFTFNINTNVNTNNVLLELPSNEEIQRSFIERGRGYQQVASYVNTDSIDGEGTCHIYSIPYEFEHFHHLNNYFQGGIFHKVRCLTMSDIDPFEYKLFQLISQAFPFLEFLSISNDRSQKDKQHSSTLIIFPYLTFLDLDCAHYDYAEQLLMEKYAHLPRLVNLCIKYKSLLKITNNFTNDATQFNFGTLKSLDVCRQFVHPENFHEYFPLL